MRRPSFTLPPGLALLAAGVLAAGATAAAPNQTACPPRDVVGGALGVKVKAPTSTTTSYAKSCAYASTPLPVKVEFQEDTATTFAASEKAVSKLGIVVVHGLGKAAWATKSGGELQVFNGHETIKIQAPLVATSKLEVLARKLL